MDLSSFGGWAWKRLRKIASEDVGIAEPGVASEVRSLYANWLDERKDDKHNPNAGRLYLCHATILLARARKDRRVDSSAIAFYEGDRPHPDVPDHPLDM